MKNLAFNTQAYKDADNRWRDAPRTSVFVSQTFRIAEYGHTWHTQESGIPRAEFCGNKNCKTCAKYARVRTPLTGTLHLPSSRKGEQK